ncbi:polysaccharide pyruvyl transferase CsaB [Leptolyngbyaceae cyanobacterium CCMR0082]|uniref:Polysaccharide pyruvyl transferase CsaB n=2 Tax=Adonisia turfae TaxID=2950184 RepID=A0A6M0S2X6_9CYAN|nr:polysaccharide pyruvyl transferase CsaB [Adonisia turfae]NEZ54574.1 polysaccharide pyruvyl transferase CsaB [Adonisia turfae CCMR0081]NEZ62746.1 polysaccharide pyruvyl transferase CsaB [Adonisia turfae CCMR0082]
MRAVLCGYYGMGNGGDEALLATLLQLLPPSVTPIVLSGNPQETAQRYGVEAVPRKSLSAVWSALKSSQAFIWGGGSLMQDATSAINPLYYGGLMILAQWLGLRTIAWGQGMGPLKRRSSQWITRWALKNCDGISVRDSASAQLLADWRINCQLAPDPVWALKSSPLAGFADLPAPRIAVVLRGHAQLTPERLTNLTKAIADFQAATQTCVVLLPFQPVKDGAIATHIAQHLNGPHKIIQVADPVQLKGVFRGIEMAIAMRFHGVVMAVAEGCRCFAISYDPKVTQIMQELSLPGWGLSPNDPLPLIPDHAHTMTQQWLDHYANGDGLSDVQVRAHVDRALIHSTLLAQTLVKDIDHVG